MPVVANLASCRLEVPLTDPNEVAEFRDRI